MRVLRSTLIVLVLLMLVGLVTAQQTTPAVPGEWVAFPVTATPGPDDPRLAICTAPTLDGFVPYVVRPGDRLADLLTGTPTITVTQLAALNCIDDPGALPVGSVIWLPENSNLPIEADDEPEAETESTEEPQADAEATELPAADEADSTEASISRFEASEETVQNQGNVTFEWQATGTEAYFYQCPPDEDDVCDRPSTAAPAPLSGEITLGNFKYAGPQRFRLEVVGESDEDTVTRHVTIEVTCSQEWLGAVTGYEACPQDPARVLFAAWQPFEGGVMIWFSDTEEIWVLTNEDQRVQVFPDTYNEGEPDPQFEAPENRFTPVRGFGRVWQALDGPDGPLGWALYDETGYDAARQPAGSRSYTTYIQGPGETVYAVTLIPQIDVRLWTQVDS
ncbi:MAG: hypothetical protein CL610_22130 [Anaerolineaceae bacterium]|nr:hypothetical protein [Anaerolineaceae bacterium]